MNTKKTGAGRPGNRPDANAIAGFGEPGKAFDPKRVPEEGEPDLAPRREPKSAPSPGIPISDALYESLKDRAKRDRKPPSKYAQEDPSGKRQK